MELKEFIRLAKINGYAGDGSEIYLPDGSRQFSFHAGDFTYIDRYSGNSSFEGTEKAWERGELVWGMNYDGSSILDPSKEVFDFLKKALRNPDPDMPLRGPESFSEGHFSYRNIPQGSFDAFKGVERIFLDSSEVYRLNYHGGSL